MPLGADDVQAAGLTHGAFYSQFESKEAVVAELKSVDGRPVTVNPNFGRATTYAPARKFQLTAVITY